MLDVVSEICLKQSQIADQIFRFSPYWLRVVGFGAVARRLVAKPHAAWAHVSQPTVRLAASPVVAGV